MILELGTGGLLLGAVAVFVGGYARGYSGGAPANVNFFGCERRYVRFVFCFVLFFFLRPRCIALFLFVLVCFVCAQLFARGFACLFAFNLYKYTQERETNGRVG